MIRRKSTSKRPSTRRNGTVAALAATLPHNPRAYGTHAIRVLDPDDESIVWDGAENGGRVVGAVATLYRAGGIVQILAGRGWERRRVVSMKDGTHHLRRYASH